MELCVKIYSAQRTTKIIVWERFCELARLRIAYCLYFCVSVSCLTFHANRAAGLYSPVIRCQKYRPYCSLLAVSAKTCVVLGWVIQFKKLRGNELPGSLGFARWPDLATPAGGRVPPCMPGSIHRRMRFLALFHTPLAYKTYHRVNAQST